MQVEMREVEGGEISIEKLKGRLSVTETVLQMFMAESKRRWAQQERFNTEIGRAVQEMQKNVQLKQDEIKDRLITLEKRIAWFMGALTALSFLLQFIARLI